MKAWFENFNRREQMSLLLLAGAVLAYLLYMLLWSPLVEYERNLGQRNDAAAVSLERVDMMVSEIQRLQKEGGGARPARSNLTTVINRSTAQQGLSVSRLQPNSRGEIQVRLEAAVFDDLLRWLHAMEYAEGLSVQELSITSTGALGRVNASIRIAQGS